MLAFISDIFISAVLLNVLLEWLKGQRKPQGSNTGVQRSVEVMPTTSQKSIANQNLNEPNESSVVGSESGSK